ncbi:MAG: hypothetical protein OK454_03685 [Thaumarchaeota archaeon]|jgi:hypothetical protein|nr:hypothetical protein [Nitrososphaerota archaeon]
MASRVREAAGTMERILLPRLNSIDGELKAVNIRLDSIKSELRSEIKIVDTKVDLLDKKLDTDRRMAILEAKVKELERKQ